VADQPVRGLAERHPSFPYVVPFLAFVVLMTAERALGVPPQVGYPIRVAVVALVTWLFSRHLVRLRPWQPLASIGIGLAVFVVWIAPDALLGYRHSWLFENSLTGMGAGGAWEPGLQHNLLFLAVRAAGSTLLVPVVEELFWRAWLMRWLVDQNFRKVPLGAYAASAFWFTAALFALEHGVYWEVGLAAGIVYNWWMVHTRSLADCILAHAVTNGALAIYVVATGAWRYWL
jgi:uncharacterized protein